MPLRRGEGTQKLREAGGARQAWKAAGTWPKARRFVCFFQAEDGIRYVAVTGVQTCALPISGRSQPPRGAGAAHARARRPAGHTRQTRCRPARRRWSRGTLCAWSWVASLSRFVTRTQGTTGLIVYHRLHVMDHLQQIEKIQADPHSSVRVLSVFCPGGAERPLRGSPSNGENRRGIPRPLSGCLDLSLGAIPGQRDSGHSRDPSDSADLEVVSMAVTPGPAWS